MRWAWQSGCVRRRVEGAAGPPGSAVALGLGAPKWFVMVRVILDSSRATPGDGGGDLEVWVPPLGWPQNDAVDP